MTVPPRMALPEEGGMLRRAWPFLRPDAWAIGLALVFSPAIAALGLFQPWLIKTAIDKHIVPGIAEGLGAIALAYFGCVVLGYGFEVGYTIAENGTELLVTVRATGSLANSGSSVQYTTVDGSALAGADYTTSSGELVFDSGDVSQTIAVPITTPRIVSSERSLC